MKKTVSFTKLKHVLLGAAFMTAASAYGQYCTPTYTTGTGDGDYIGYVGLEAIDNATGAAASPYYTDFTALSADLNIGGSHTIYLGSGSYTSNNDLHVWIDYNHDMDFSDPGEYVAQVLDLGAFAIGSDIIDVPADAIAGSTRMRVREIWGSPVTPDPCGSYSYGETEDYTVNLIGGDMWDVGVTAITNPVTAASLGVEDVIVTVYNFGSEPISGFEVYYQVDGGLITGGFFVGTLAPYTSASYTMPEGWDFSADGCYDILAWTEYDDDEDAANDSYSTTVCNLGAVTGTGAYYLYSNVFGMEPWGSVANTDAMNTAFGPEGTGWTRAYFETVDPVTVFNPDNCFVFIEGSDFMAAEMETFLNTNMSLIEDWVGSGGSILLNAAPNEGIGMSLGFGGTMLVYPYFTATADAADAGHPIFNGPNLPAGTVYSGTSFGHAVITGTGLTTVMYDDAAPSNIVLAEKSWGDGIVMFGGMTTSNWHSPVPNANNLRANIFSYLGCTADVPVCETTTGLYTDEVTATTATLHWDAAEGATDYLVTVCDRANKIVTIKTATSTTELPVTGLTPGGSYYFKVKTYCTDVDMVGLISEKYYFTTPVRLGDAENIVNVYPNPTEGQFTLSLAGYEGNTLNVAIYNSVGQVVFNGVADVTTAVNNFTIDLGDVANGIYQIRLTNNDLDLSSSLIISK